MVSKQKLGDREIHLLQWYFVRDYFHNMILVIAPPKDHQQAERSTCVATVPRVMTPHAVTKQTTTDIGSPSRHTLQSVSSTTTSFSFSEGESRSEEEMGFYYYCGQEYADPNGGEPIEKAPNPDWMKSKIPLPTQTTIQVRFIALTRRLLLLAVGC